MSWLSILGMYNYDNTIFDNLALPEGINKENVVDSILMNCAELELLYQSIDIMKIAIKNWSENNQYTWFKLYKTTTLDYNPIWNVDGVETETEVIGRTLDRDTTNSGTVNGTASATDTRSVKGFNETGWAEAEKNERQGTDSQNLTGNESEDVAENTQRTFTKERHGNIGVTTTQKMIEEERKVAEFNIVDYITQSFKERFCLLVY